MRRSRSHNDALDQLGEPYHVREVDPLDISYYGGVPRTRAAAPEFGPSGNPFDTGAKLV